jgi:hypothetical protein
VAKHQPEREDNSRYPEKNDDGSSPPADRPIQHRRCRFTMLGHDRRRDQSHDRSDPGWHDDQIVQVAQHRDEVRDQIDW